MPEHTSWLTLLLGYMHETLGANAQAFGESVVLSFHRWKAFWRAAPQASKA